MKKLSYFISLACIALFASCSSDVEDFNVESNSEGKTVTIGVSLPTEDDTRVSTEALDSMVWETGDVLKAVCFNEWGWKAGDPAIFTMSEGAKSGTGTTSFTGTIPADATSCRYLYTTLDINSLYFDGTSQGILLPDGTIQEQSVINSSAHIKNYLILASETYYSPNIATGNVHLTPMNAILRLNVRNMPEELANATSCNIKWSFGYMKAEMNLNCQMVDKSDNFIYMVIPTQYGYNTNDIMKVEFTSGLNSFVAKAKSRISDNMGYKAGMIYTAVIDNTSTPEAPALVWDVKEENKVNLSECLQLKFNNGNPDKVGLYNKVGEAAGGYSYYLNSNSVNAIVSDPNNNNMGAFQGNAELTHVIIPANITSIGATSFMECSSLQEVTFAEGSQLKEIGDNAFSWCNGLKNIVIPEGVTTLGSWAFQRSGLQSITIPSTVTTIGGSLLKKCNAMYNVYFNVPMQNLTNSMKSAIKNLNGNQGYFILEQANTTTVLHLPVSYKGCSDTSIFSTNRHGEKLFCGFIFPEIQIAEL